MAKTKSKSPINPSEIQTDDKKKEMTSQLLELSLCLASMTKCDLFDPDDVSKHIEDFFQLHIQYQAKPSCKGLAMALGIPPDTLSNIRHNRVVHLRNAKNIPEKTKALIKRAYDVIDNMFEQYLQNGMIHPTMGIFLGVNNYGYKNTNDVTIEQRNEERPKLTAEEIQKRYLSDGTEETEKAED